MSVFSVAKCFSDACFFFFFFNDRMLCFSDENSSSVHTVDVLREMDIALSMVTEADIAVLKEVTAMISQRAAYIVAAGLSLFWQYIHIYIYIYTYTHRHAVSEYHISSGFWGVVMF